MDATRPTTTMEQQPLKSSANTMVKQTAENILQRMDEQLIDLVEFEPAAKAMSSPEREVHVDEGKRDITISHSVVSIALPPHMLLNCASVLEDRRNPEDTAPISTAFDGWSFSSISSSGLNASNHSEQRLKSSFYLGDDESEVSLLLDQEETSSPAPESCSDDGDSVISIQGAVDAIREEAARMETAFAIDRLQTLESEFRSMKKLLHAQADQIHHLKRELKAKDDTLATVELERDLLEADIEALRDSRRVAARSSMNRMDVISPLDSLAAAGMKSPEAESSLDTGATLASSEGSPAPAARLCEVERRDSTSISTKHTALDSPLLSVSSGGSTQLEEYLCNMDMSGLQERQKPVPVSMQGVEVQLPATTTKEASNRAAANKSTSSEGQPRVCMVSNDADRKTEVVCKAQRQTGPTVSSSQQSIARAAEKSRLSCGKPTDARPVYTTKAANNLMPVGTKHVPTKPAESSKKEKRRFGTIVSLDRGANEGGLPMHGQDKNTSALAQEEVSVETSLGSSKENRVSRQKKPCQFKPIHPGKQHVSRAQQVLTPIPRRVVTSSRPQPLSPEDNISQSDASFGSDCPQNSMVSNSLLVGSPSTASPEKQMPVKSVPVKPKTDRTGAFPTFPIEKSQARATQFDADEEDDTPKTRKSGVPFFRRRKSQKDQRTSVSSKCLEDRDSLQGQVEELAQRLRTSVEGSEDLRKRLAMISRYYETTVHRLSENIVSLKQEQAAMQVDLTKQIKGMDRERLVAMKRTELLLKEQQIAKFKRKQRR